MICPAGCDTHLVMTERSSIEIDYCPACRGVWLDRGELDKIIDRNAATVPDRSPAAERPGSSPSPPRGRDRDRDRNEGPPRKKKRGGFLEDLFEF